jgi:hypothetical protein
VKKGNILDSAHDVEENVSSLLIEKAEFVLKPTVALCSIEELFVQSHL